MQVIHLSQYMVLELHHKKLQPEPASEMESEAMA